MAKRNQQPQPDEGEILREIATRKIEAERIRVRQLADENEKLRTMAAELQRKISVANARVAELDKKLKSSISEKDKEYKQEIKDESKQQEGDPLIRGMRRSKARELSRNRMIASVAEADVVLVNPVRLAVALRYRDGDLAPIVVAKGMGVMARRIRSEAYRHGVAVRQDKPLARAIYRRCQVGQMIPPELYEAVAVVLAAVLRARNRRRRPAMVASCGLRP